MSELPIFTFNKHEIEDGDMSGNLSSSIIDISEVTGYCVHAIWSGAPVGNLLIEGSNDSSNFVAVNTQATGGASGQHLLNVEKIHYRYLRVRFSFTSGTGTLNCYISAKRA